MKALKYITVICVILLMGLFACNDDFLQEEPRSFLSPELAYKTDEGLASGAVGLYDELGYPYYNSTTMRRTWALTNGATDYTQMGLQRDLIPLNELNSEYTPAAQSAEQALSLLWPHYYRIANNATTVIEYSAEHEWNNEELRKQTEGEAYFFRGHAHFHLTMLWGDVPMIKEVIKGVKLDFINSP